MRHLAALVILIVAAAACSSDGDSSATEPGHVATFLRGDAFRRKGHRWKTAQKRLR